MPANIFKWIPLFKTNFLGVLNDNFLKNLICFISISWVAKNHESLVISIASALLVVPYVLFSPIAGRLSETRSKRKILQIAKWIEIPIMIIAVFGFIYQSLFLVLTAMFLMGVQSCLYSPAKYGLIRDIGGVQGISFGTGSMEMLTFIGVLIGTFLGGLVSDMQTNQSTVLISLLIGFAVAGLIISYGIKAKEPETQISKTTLNPIRFIGELYTYSRQTKGLLYVIFFLSSFWLIGSMIQMNLYLYCPEMLEMTDTETGIVLALMAIGIGLGSGFAGIVSGKKLKLILIPIGGFGLALSISLIYLLTPSSSLFTGLLIAAAFFGGLFKIPLNAFIQERVIGRMLGQVIAFNNLSVFSFILISAVLFYLFEQIAGIQSVFLFVAAFTWIITILSIFKIPGIRLIKSQKEINSL